MFKPSTITALIAALLVLAGCNNNAASSPAANWTLDGANSSINFISVKNGDVVESNRFDVMNGQINRDGVASIEIQADSVYTQIDTRDERLRRYMFQTEEFPLVSISANVDQAAFGGLGVGNSAVTSQELTVSMAGQTHSHFATVRVTRTARDRVLITTVDPVLIDVRDYGLSEGLEALTNLASLESISPVTPVTVFLTFQRQ